ncbi:MAG: disulfide bond formation protein B [Kordiimonadaceae bacterium]|nr:disulfide bond formation protein B [Kordiimonadaceae bacterium]MBO6567804.1 disulfide bond formation protein B [Kordiimonadaceae bacterium]MBO6962981.1 disulfide bond formation protein B [Kordiimonadaceae bacterium]
MSNSIFSLPNRNPVLFAGVAAAVILASAFGFQFYGYHPCDMCWWQRYPYMVAMGVALFATAVQKIPQKWILFLLALTFAVDAGLAMFHVGVEQRWWEGISTCSGMVGVTDSVNDALDAIMNAPLIRCDEIAWSLFGISMAGYNFLLATGLTVFCVSKARQAK